VVFIQGWAGASGMHACFTRQPGKWPHPHGEGGSMKRLLTLLMLVLFSSMALTACNTIAGAGKDVQKAGEKVSDKAQDCKDMKC